MDNNQFIETFDKANELAETLIRFRCEVAVAQNFKEINGRLMDKIATLEAENEMLRTDLKELSDTYKRK